MILVGACKYGEHDLRAVVASLCHHDPIDGNSVVTHFTFTKK